VGEPTGAAALIPGGSVLAEPAAQRPPRADAPRDKGALLLVGQALLLGFSIAATILTSSPPELRDAVLLVTGSLAAAVQCLWAASAARAEPRAFRAWALVAAGLVAWAAADYRYYLLGEYELGVAPLTHALYLLYYAFTACGLLSFPSAARPAPLRLTLDVATVALGGSMAVSYLVLEPLARQAGQDWTEAAVIVPYAVGDLVLLLASSMLVLKPRHRETQPAFRLLALGQLLSFAFGIVYAAEALVADHAVYMKGYLLVQLLVATAAHRHRLAARDTQPAAAAPEPRARPSRLPYAAIALGFATFIYAAAREGDARLYAPALLAAALTAVVVARQALTVREETRLRVEREARLVEEREKRRADAERERLLAELEARNAELERFTYSVSHDLKSPLITIRGFVDQLRIGAREGHQERLQADLDRIANAASQMNRLLGDLLELSRIGRIINPLEPVSLRALAQEAVELVGGRLQNAELVVAEDLPQVRGDRPRLVEVLQNLLDNAAQFRGEAGRLRVEIGMRAAGPERVFYVRDNGIGIEPRHHERVFGLFQKLDPRSPGTGVGLALARRIVEAHGGRIWVESEGRGRGSTFCFTLREG
jgi:signal transduction histidine kinase